MLNLQRAAGGQAQALQAGGVEEDGVRLQHRGAALAFGGPRQQPRCQRPDGQRVDAQ
jgi:hypothetical protein